MTVATLLLVPIAETATANRTLMANLDRISAMSASAHLLAMRVVPAHACPAKAMGAKTATE